MRAAQDQNAFQVAGPVRVLPPLGHAAARCVVALEMISRATVKAPESHRGATTLRILRRQEGGLSIVRSAKRHTIVGSGGSA